MKLLTVAVFFVLLSGVLAALSSISLQTAQSYAKISTKGGLYVSITILIFMLFGELGYLPYRFKGKKKRSTNEMQLMNPALFSDRNTVLKVCNCSYKN